ncbi:DUF445 domain-containing protein [Acidisphaera sp. L21]|uniref:DUF445 domain-containing protein n=1 Tax=Acidisphaera sp. L21 TaxID=1641851 RepID=UPI00131B9DCA|nr:DUF445 domain-containing protein [Acidisphaera sp. L21]
MTVVDPDRLARRSLARHRAFATGLLVLMAALTLGSYAMPPGWGTDLLQAAAKAGLVGGIADWFAITALFRHPLGLPIPHTAIIPAQKERLGRALGRFVSTHVFTEAELRRTLGRIDIPGILHRFFADPKASRPAAEALAGMLPRLLATVEDGRARRLIARLVPRILGGRGASAVVARALHGLLDGGRHQDVLTFILAQFRLLLTAKEEQLRTVIAERVREQGGRIVGWALGAQVARRVLTTLNGELDKIGPDGSDLRDAFDTWMRAEIARMESDPERAAEVGRAIRQVVAHETVQAWIWDIWARMRLALEADAAKPGGHTVAFIESALANLGTLLESDRGVRTRLQSAAEVIVMSVLPSAQASLSGFIADAVGNWDTATLVDRIELRVGKDLQFVRVNGTVVGFLVGGALYAVLKAVFGVVSF